MTTQTKPVLLSTAQAARMLGVDIRTVQRLAEAETLSSTAKLPGTTGAYVFALSDVKALKRRRATAARKAQAEANL
jgi:hypothetical protein